MMIRVSELQDEGLTIDDASALAGAFGDPSWHLERVYLEVKPDGVDVVVQGELSATVPQTCGRCLETLPARVNATVDVRLLPRPATADPVKLAPDDLDVDFYANGEVDVARVVETETTLALPMKPLCRDDCRGLCAVCGGNRNVVECACVQRAPDPRLAVLKDLKLT
jgi:DUF177 domain-containing protein